VESRVLRRLPALAALALAVSGALALALASAVPVKADDATLPPFTSGHHLYDYGDVFTTKTAAAVEALASHIESLGGGRVAVLTEPDSVGQPDTSGVAQAWGVDGILLTGSGDSGELAIGQTLNRKLTSDQQDLLDSSPSMSTLESWMLDTLARVDGELSKTHVWDGAGLFDAAGKSKAEAAATALGDQIGGPVYVDIALGGDDPSSTAFFNAAHLSGHLGDHALVVAICVTGSNVGGSIEEDGLFDAYHTVAPWKSDTLSNTNAPGDTAAYVLTLLDAVKNGSEFQTNFATDILPWIIFVIVVVVFSITAPFLWGPWLIKKLTGAAMPIANGIPTSAVIQSIGDTGMTVSMPSVGPEAPEYKLGLLVNPPAGGSPYAVEIKAIIPRIFIPTIVPGATIGVLVDPTDPQKVSLDIDHLNNPAGAAPFGAATGQAFTPAPASTFGAQPGSGMDLSFDQSGNPNLAQVSAFASAVSAGRMPTHSGSAAQLLATGTHGTAVVTSAIPLGKKVRDVNPSADPSTLDDPLWMFTVEVTLAGQSPFPAVFGHRVPRDKAGLIGPGTKLAVAVNEADKNQEVAIDWNQSPLTTF